MLFTAGSLQSSVYNGKPLNNIEMLSYLCNMRKAKVFKSIDRQDFIRQLVLYARHTNPFLLLDSAGYSNTRTENPYVYLAAVDALDTIRVNGQAIDALHTFQKKHNDWVFGHLTYDIKNETENLHSANEDRVQFPYFHFFVPKYVLEIHNDHLIIHYPDVMNDKEVDHIYRDIRETKLTDSPTPNIQLQARQTRDDYLENIHQLKKHISRGDIYEVNYATEFYREQIDPDPHRLYLKLREITPAPMSCFYKTHDHYLLSGSPERYIAKTGNRLISQPIKGTAKRGLTTEQDEAIKHELLNSPKDRTENIMITDLVRNDLSRIARKGSVHVDELCGLYTFTYWHQLISTVSCHIDPRLPLSRIITSTFPMGSMTGAPKISAMRLIEQYEKSKRGIFSGSVGYIKPNGDFDFNVVIRSLAYNKSSRYLSCMVGGAITSQSDPEAEYEECLLKAKGINELLNQPLAVHAP